MPIKQEIARLHDKEKSQVGLNPMEEKLLADLTLQLLQNAHLKAQSLSAPLREGRRNDASNL
jgi:hypothetical protein